MPCNIYDAGLWCHGCRLLPSHHILSCLVILPSLGQDVFEYMHRYGLPDESCQIYQAKSSQYCDAAAICHNCMPIGDDIFPYKCWAVEDPAKVYVKEYG